MQYQLRTASADLPLLKRHLEPRLEIDNFHPAGLILQFFTSLLHHLNKNFSATW